MNKIRSLAGFAIAAMLAVGALSPAAWAGSCTVGTSAAACVPAVTAKSYRSVTIDNEGVDKICVTDDGTAPVCGAAGTYTILPGKTRHWGDSNVTWQGPFNAISPSASQAVTYTAE